LGHQIAQANPHATLSPTFSAEGIKRHVKDGLESGRAWGLPQEILDIIAQHHGSTRIEYFYRKALEESPNGTEVNEADFRYSSGLPRSKEAGIVMLADSVCARWPGCWGSWWGCTSRPPPAASTGGGPAGGASTR
jgi:membrane-associated HD superfamily phosphohydrolase